jgi:hypothetical protein
VASENLDAPWTPEGLRCERAYDRAVPVHARKNPRVVLWLRQLGCCQKLGGMLDQT